jgi:hypothetical protein
MATNATRKLRSGVGYVGDKAMKGISSLYGSLKNRFTRKTPTEPMPTSTEPMSPPSGNIELRNDNVAAPPQTDQYFYNALNNTQSEEEFKKIYKQLATQVHPDNNNNSPESTAKFQSLRKAYDSLIQERKYNFKGGNKNHKNSKRVAKNKKNKRKTRRH